MTAPRRRRAVQVLLAGAALALSVLAWPWLYAGVVQPAALVAWLLLRTLVLSVHQAVYWTAVAAAVPVLLFLLIQRRAGPGHLDRIPEPAGRPHPVEGWRVLIEQAAAGEAPAPIFGWSGFVHLTVALRAQERRVAPDYRLHDALRAGQSPLPPEVQAFLFPGARPQPGGWSLLRRIGDGARRALRRLSGRERADRLRSISQLLSFLEASLEMPPHDDDRDRGHR